MTVSKPELDRLSDQLDREVRLAATQIVVWFGTTFDGENSTSTQ